MPPAVPVPLPAPPPPAALTALRARLGPGFLLGQGPSGPLGSQARRLAGAIADALGLDAAPVRVHVVESQTLVSLARALGGALPAHLLLDGLTTGGEVYVQAVLGRVRDATLVHEVLHVLSGRFAAGAHARGHHRLVEGLTEHFTRRVVREPAVQMGGLLRRPTYRPYGHATAVADALTARVGEDALARFFFFGRWDELERAIDGRLGAGVLEQAARALDQDDVGAALAALEEDDGR